jgi:hypothetical protein
MKKLIFLIALFMLSCSEHEAQVARAKKLAIHFLDSLYKPHKIALGGFSYFEEVKGPEKKYSMRCEYTVFRQNHDDTFIFNSSITKVEQLGMMIN